MPGPSAPASPATAPAAVSPAWAELGWGLPLPEGLRPENDWPWVPLEGATCGWEGRLLLCDDGAGLSRAYVEITGPVEGRPHWLRCAGLEWCLGALSEGALDRGGAPPLHLGRWARVGAPGGWAWASLAPPKAPEDQPGSPLALEGGEAWGAAREALAARLGGCEGAEALDRFPAQVIYRGGVAVKVRLQGFPPEGVDAACLARALGGTPAGARSVEVMIGG